MRRKLLWLSLLLNFLLLAGLFFIIQRLGGVNFALHRVTHDEAGLYSHRKQMFEMLPPTNAAIVFLGDSQTEQGEWHELLDNEALIINRGIVADWVRGVHGRLDKVLYEKPRMIFLQIGINDLIQNASVSTISLEYKSLVADIRKKSPETSLILQSVFPVNNDVKWVGAKNEDIKALNSEIQAIAKEFALPYLDIFTNLTDADGNLHEQFTEDGIHLNGKGYLVWKKAIEQWISK